jgi:4-hydroxybenzoate polyprenyltransferase
LHSIPAKFGQANAFRLAMFLHFWIFPIAWAIYGVGNFSWFWVVGMLLLFLLLGYLHFFRKSSSLDKMNSDFFIGNVALSVVVLLAVALEVFV